MGPAHFLASSIRLSGVAGLCIAGQASKLFVRDGTAFYLLLNAFLSVLNKGIAKFAEKTERLFKAAASTNPAVLKCFVVRDAALETSGRVAALTSRAKNLVASLGVLKATSNLFLDRGAVTLLVDEEALSAPNAGLLIVSGSLVKEASFSRSRSGFAAKWSLLLKLGEVADFTFFFFKAGDLAVVERGCAQSAHSEEKSGGDGD